MTMQSQIGEDIAKAAELLRAGELVGIPTETVYGLAGNALSDDAALKIFKAKNRPFFDPLIVHIHSITDIANYVTEIPRRLQPLMEQYMPGPLTVLLPRRDSIPDLVTSGLNRVAIRVPSHPLTQRLLRSLDFPLAAPSANPFGYISPTTAYHVYDQLQGLIPYILDGGECQVGLESTIVGMEGDEILIHRLGGIGVEQIEAIVGQVRILQYGSSHITISPGSQDKHYAPRKRLIVGNIPALIVENKDRKIAVISFSDSYEVAYQEILSPTQNIDEAAKKLFSAMRKIDATDADVILTETLPDVGLGRAINDRLRRAAFHKGLIS